MTEEYRRWLKLSRRGVIFLGKQGHCGPILLDSVDVTKYFLSAVASVECTPPDVEGRDPKAAKVEGGVGWKQKE